MEILWHRGIKLGRQAINAHWKISIPFPPAPPILQVLPRWPNRSPVQRDHFKIPSQTSGEVRCVSLETGTCRLYPSYSPGERSRGKGEQLPYFLYFTFKAHLSLPSRKLYCYFRQENDVHREEIVLGLSCGKRTIQNVTKRLEVEQQKLKYWDSFPGVIQF